MIDAVNGTDGLRLARAHTFDLIICDLLMPGLDGFTVIAALHDEPATRNVPVLVLVLTSQSLAQDDRNRLAGKTLAIIAKGGETPADLQDWIHRITENHRDHALIPADHAPRGRSRRCTPPFPPMLVTELTPSFERERSLDRTVRCRSAGPRT